MNNHDSARSFRPAIAGGDSFVPAPSGFHFPRAVEDGFDVESWLGYESIHPLTWVPGLASANGGLRVE